MNEMKIGCSAAMLFPSSASCACAVIEIFFPQGTKDLALMFCALLPYRLVRMVKGLRYHTELFIEGNHLSY